jgi:hypothetical protein
VIFITVLCDTKSLKHTASAEHFVKVFFAVSNFLKVNSLRIKSEPLFEEAGLHYFPSDQSFPLVGNPSSARNNASRK